MAINARLGKILYAVIFCGVLPLLLILWAQAISIHVALGDHHILGQITTLVGAVLMATGMHNLWFYGKGLPMNGYPPSRHVQSGVYKIFNHPIYVGFCLVCAGVSVWYGSAAGLLLITPVVTLACWALVVGYEAPDLKNRFGEAIKNKTLFSLPEAGEQSPTFKEKLRAAVAIFLPWAILYELFVWLGVSSYFIDTNFQFEKQWPVYEWTVIPYVSIYLFAALTPFLQRSKNDLRAFMLNAWWTIGLGSFFLFVFPFFASQRLFEPTDWQGKLILWERGMDSTAAAFPSFHVMWALVAAHGWSSVFKKSKTVWWMWAILISVSCSSTGNHSVADVLAGIVVYIIVINRFNIWRFIQSKCEILANSWRSSMIGPLRVINHSLYADLGGFVGIFLVTQFVSEDRAIITVVAATLLGGAVWGQYAEGSSIMLRPFGYYGAILGGMIGTFISYYFMGTSLPILIAAFAMASPVIQALGRLRCLVQGCCHGAVTTKPWGIIYLNEHSRVCQISGMKGVPVHNTQLYSIIGNAIAFAILMRLWYAGASASMLIGLYFILNGIARFVEEAYRGEVQTKIILKLRLYQWLAIVSLLAGAAITTISTEPVPIALNFSLSSLATSTLCGFMCAFAMGMDFPKSKVPFSRLTG